MSADVGSPVHGDLDREHVRVVRRGDEASRSLRTSHTGGVDESPREARGHVEPALVLLGEGRDFSSGRGTQLAMALDSVKPGGRRGPAGRRRRRPASPRCARCSTKHLAHAPGRWWATSSRTTPRRTPRASPSSTPWSRSLATRHREVSIAETRKRSCRRCSIPRRASSRWKRSPDSSGMKVTCHKRREAGPAPPLRTFARAPLCPPGRRIARRGRRSRATGRLS